MCVAGVPEEVLPAAPGASAQTANASGFHGCIRKLYINQELQDFTRSSMRPGVEPGCPACSQLHCAHGECGPTPTQVSRRLAGWSFPRQSCARRSFASSNRVYSAGPSVSLPSRLGGATL